MPLTLPQTAPDQAIPLALTMGCPAGVGPEIILKLFALLPVHETAGFVVIGDRSVLDRCGKELGLAAPLADWRPGMDLSPGLLPVVSLCELASGLTWGKPTEITGRAMIGFIERAVAGIMAGHFSGLVTCPIAKIALRLAGSPFPGHTEMLAELSGGRDYAMMMAADRLKVTLVTIHQPLAAVPGLLNVDAVAGLISLTGRSLIDDFGIPRPRIAVAGLNPHAGEAGMFGREEETVIAPAVRRAVAAGWQAFGPLPPDTVFVAAARGDYDAVVCMYHDQGLIPFKLLHFKDGVNVTIGLPIVRTSVDHGTAYDIAGCGVADCASLAAAVSLAGNISKNRRLLAMAGQ